MDTNSKSNWYIYTLLGSSLITTASPYVTTRLASPYGRFAAHVIAATILYLTSLALLSLAAAEHWRLHHPSPSEKSAGKQSRLLPGRTAYLATWATGFLAGAYAFVLPLLVPSEHPLVQGGLRIGTFFAGCKLWDVTITWSDKPPLPVRGRDQVLYGLVRWQDHAGYVWDILASTRYAAFDTAVDKTGRRREPPSRAWTYGPLVTLPLAYLFPVAELQTVAGLTVIWHALEMIHGMLLHRHCGQPLFFQPFSATTPSEFWSCHWHQTAQPFLFSLGFVPARAVFGRLFGRQVGKAAGLLGAFSLSGLWHAWGAAPLTKAEYSWNQSVGLWAVFTLQGVVVIVEKAALRDDKWRRGWRKAIAASVFWFIAIESISMWLRYIEPHSLVLPLLEPMKESLWNLLHIRS